MTIAIGSGLYEFDPVVGVFRKSAQVGQTKTEGDRTYQLNENHRWERVNQNIGRTVRRLERQGDTSKLRWLARRMENEGTDDVALGSDAAYSAASRLEESQSVRESLSNYPDAHNPKKLKGAIATEIAKPKPKIGTLRRIAKIAQEASDAYVTLNENLSESLMAIADEAAREAELLQDAAELKQHRDMQFEMSDGKLMSHMKSTYSLSGMEPFTIEITVAFPSVESKPELLSHKKQTLLDRYQAESDPWRKQAILKEMMTVPVKGAVKKIDMGDGEGFRFYRFGQLPEGKKTTWAGATVAYQEIQESDLSPEEKQWLSYAPIK